jgi:hypothetical protein
LAVRSDVLDMTIVRAPPHCCDPKKHASTPRHPLSPGTAGMESISRISGLLETGMYAFRP